MRRLRLWLARFVAPRGVEVLEVGDQATDVLRGPDRYREMVGDSMSEFRAEVERQTAGQQPGRWMLSVEDMPLRVVWPYDEDGRPIQGP